MCLVLQPVAVLNLASHLQIGFLASLPHDTPRNQGTQKTGRVELELSTTFSSTRLGVPLLLPYLPISWQIMKLLRKAMPSTRMLRIRNTSVLGRESGKELMRTTASRVM
ncbi:MAG: hypothetical protein J3R72DRAFT_421332 [Linnemannia gamsii]|nr:MAG: hypothetical protein J3R72DRAFT_421332 [Linnemannia gamsii]